MFRLSSCLLGALCLHFAVLYLPVHSNPPMPVSSINDESILVTLNSWLPPAEQKSEVPDTSPPVVKEFPQEVERVEEKLTEHVPPKPVETVAASSKKPVYTPQRPASKPTVQTAKKKKRIKQPAEKAVQKTIPAARNIAGKATMAAQSASSVSTRAKPLYHHNPKPVYPPLAQRRGWEGTVILLVEVLPNGDCRDIQIKQTSGYTLLDKAAVKAVKRWKFTPGLENGIPQTTVILVPIRFSLRTS